jgi:hypothetical protein
LPLIARRRRLVIAFGIACAITAALWLRGEALLGAVVERIATRALGRDLRIDGPLDLSLSRAPRVTARDVRLANASWASDPTMIHVGRVTIQVELASIFSGPVRVLDLELDETRVLLERGGDGGGNWTFGAGKKPAAPEPGPRKPPPVVVERAAIRGFELSYRARPGASPTRFVVEALDAKLDPGTQMVELHGAGVLDEVPWGIDGRLGTFAQIYDVHDVDQDLTFRLGEMELRIEGRIGDPLVLGRPGLAVTAHVPDLAAGLGLFGVRSPVTGPLRLTGKLTPTEEGVHADLQAAAGGITAVARIGLRSLLSPGPFEATVELSGPDASVIGGWAGVPGLSPRPFDLLAHVRREEARYLLEMVRLRVGPNSVSVTGVLGDPPGLLGTDLFVRAVGRDLVDFSRVAHRPLPRGSFELSGRILRDPSGFAVEGLTLTSQRLLLRATGRLGELPRLESLDLSIDTSGPDLSAFSGLVGAALPPAPFALRGRVARDGRTLELHGIEVRLGEDSATAEGKLVLARRLQGSGVRLRAAGPDLSRLASRAGLTGFPRKPYRIAGRIAISRRGYELDDVVASVGDVSAEVKGRVGAPPGFDRTELSVRARGQALSDLAAFGIPAKLPAEPFSMEGQVRIEGGVLRLEAMSLSVGPDKVTLNGALGTRPGLSGLDLELDASGPSLAGPARLLAAAGIGAPAGVPENPYQLTGRVRRAPAGWELRDVRARLGAAEARADGVIGAGKALAGTDVRIGASGPDLAAALGPAGGPARLPPAPFEISAQVVAGEGRLTVKGLAARLGRSDLEGTITVALGGKPSMDAELRSSRLDLAELVARPAAEKGPGPAATPAPPPPPGRLVVSDRPFDLAGLRALDARLHLEAAEVSSAGLQLRRVIVEGELRQGALRLERVEGATQDGGEALLSFALEPSDGGQRLTAKGKVKGLPLLAANPDGSKSPVAKVEFQLEARGRSPHEIAASLDGTAHVVVGAGRLPNSYRYLTSDVLRGLLDVLNPFRKSSTHTDFECGIALVTVQRGKVVVHPLAARTDKLTVVGKGKVDMSTEDIDLQWTIKPRTGIGISASSIANPYIKLGGTLAAPQVAVKPIRAAANTGAAIFTLGLTVFARGFYDRVTAEKNVCLDELVKGAREGE